MPREAPSTSSWPRRRPRRDVRRYCTGLWQL